MSWMKRRGHTTPSPAPGPHVQMYNPNQHSNQETQWPQQDLSTSSTTNWYNQHPPQNPQQKQYPYNQTPQQQSNYWQQPYGAQYNQNQANQYQQQQYTQPIHPQSNFYQNPMEQRSLANDQYNQQSQYKNPYGQQAQKVQGDAWGNWASWGDEDNSNVQSMPTLNDNSNQANAIADSFTTEDTWNWTIEDSTSTTSTNYTKNDPSSTSVSHTSLESYRAQNLQNPEELFPKMGKLSEKHAPANADSVDDEKADPLRIPSAVRLKKSNHLTPQWSTESQMSQESSDDVLQTSESDKILSRSSTISQSPISGQDAATIDNLPQIEEKHEVNSKQGFAKNSQYENIEILSNIKQEGEDESGASGISHTPPSPQNRTPPLPIKNLPPPPLKNQTPPPPMKNQTPPLPMKEQTPPLAPQSSSEDGKNPYKRAGLSHRAANKTRPHNNTSLPDRPPMFGGFPPFTQTVNLETLPDNSEQPDNLVPVQPVRKISPGLQQIPDNNEMISERNQYLETGRLSDENAAQSHQEVADTLPPPGLRRMVLGQMESSEIRIGSDEPPPGLSRMVLGQTESTTVNNQKDPPIGFSRMIPGESSSPETASRQYQYNDEPRQEEYNSEGEMNQLINVAPQPRSATIGADTPPVINPVQSNRSETIGSDSNLHKDNISTVERPESIEGQRENDMNSLTIGIRDLSVDSHPSLVDEPTRRPKESSESDREEDRSKSPRDKRDRRYHDDRREKRGRYTPDSYHDKRYDRRRKDRRYHDESDYYSDREKDRRRDEKEKRDEYERKYNSLRKDKEQDRRRRDYGKEYDRREYDRKEGRDYDRKDGRDYDRKEGREYERKKNRNYDRQDSWEYERARGKDYYYGRYEDGGHDDVPRSRPSSRSDSMHESYRNEHDDHRRYRNRERERTRRHRGDYNPYAQGFAYDPYNPYYQQYQLYYENLRRTNPQAYAEWYRKYYQQATSSATFGTEDRASVHSGRSSANEEIKERYLRQGYYSHSTLPAIGGYYRESHSISGQYGIDDSSYSRPYDATDSSVVLDDTVAQVQRLTPAKFATAHAKASISSGKCVKILPHYPVDGQSAVIEFISLQNLLVNDDELDELVGFPGPLVRGVTHKKTVIEYCESKIRAANYNDDIGDPESYVLMWELMILLIRQNGMVVGTDIAELLMKNKQRDSGVRPSSAVSSASSAFNEANTVSEASNVPTESAGNNSISGLREELVTNKFREYLIYGSGKEALEWAMKHGLWGHALFLASKLDKRTYASVMMRFANGLTMNDPLQTLYQLLSGRLPASVTSVADEKWGDWRPHLAMILSNTTSRPELDRKAITTLADTLMSRGSLYAAQFCYLMAEVGFSRYGSESAKLVLLGSNHNRPYMQFATNEAIHLTEIYEYACSLNDPCFIIMEFQPYKYLISTRLSDRGLLEKALAYLERVAIAIVENPSAVQPNLVDKVCHLADRLKHVDPIGDADDTSGLDSDLDTSRPDICWLKELKSIQSDYNMGLISHRSNNVADQNSECELVQQQQVVYDQQLPQDNWHQHQQDNLYQQGSTSQWSTEQSYEHVQQENHSHEQQQEGYVNQYQQDPQQNYWPNQQWPESSQSSLDPYQGRQQETHADEQQTQQQNDYWNVPQNEPKNEVEKPAEEETPVQPQISMPNQSKGQTVFNEIDQGKEKSAKQSTAQKSDKQTSSGWFGGIFSKLALRPKNQMKLPDDKNPSIVWDPEKKKWVNLEEDTNDVSNELKPPPKMSDFMPKVNAPPGIPQAQPISQHQHPLLTTAPPVIANQPVHESGARANNGPSQQQFAAAPISAPAANAPVPASADEAPKSTQPNMFKMQRSRNLKKSYVDVFNPGGKPNNAPAMLQSPLMGNQMAFSEPHMNFFIPAPVSDPNAPMDFLTPAPVNNENQMSRWSSTSSLSKEVQYYMQQKPKNNLAKHLHCPPHHFILQPVAQYQAQ